MNRTRRAADLYDYGAHGLGPVEGVQAVQTAPAIRTVKRAGTLIGPPQAALRPPSTSRTAPCTKLASSPAR
jgi:hypothetical protein